MAGIITFADRFGERSLLEHASLHPSSIGDLTLPAPGVALGVTAEAVVNHSRWVAHCPCDHCTGAEMVNAAELLFFCCECRNAEWDHHPIRVVMPAEKTRSQVEAYLVARPALATRNWRPEESVTGLRDENREHEIRL